jgi:hypothetical protein
MAGVSGDLEKVDSAEVKESFITAINTSSLADRILQYLHDRCHGKKDSCNFSL